MLNGFFSFLFLITLAEDEEIELALDEIYSGNGHPYSNYLGV